MTIEIKEGYSRLEDIRSLFGEYTASLGIDLTYQNYAQELADLPGKYARPDGILYLALVNQTPAGCIAMRRFDAQTCEMKRLYVRDAFRGHRLGEQLVQTVINQARAIGYSRLVLDTLADMDSALRLYKKLGFIKTHAYYDTPIKETVFMSLTL